MPNDFHKPAGNQIGTKIYTICNNPRDILDNLRSKYGACTPNKNTANNLRFDQPQDSNELIQALFDCLKECYIFSIMANPPFTLDQVIDKAIMAIQRIAYTKLHSRRNGKVLMMKPNFCELQSRKTEVFKIEEVPQNCIHQEIARNNPHRHSRE